MKIHKFKAFMVSAFLSSMSVLCADVYKLVEPTKIAKYEDITFYLRMPNSWDVEADRKNMFNEPIPAVRGLIAVCTWQTRADDIRGNLEMKGRFSHIIKFAEENNLAVICWTNFKGYRHNEDTVDFEEERAERYEKDYDKRAREWEMGFKRICKKYSLPMHDTMLYGISGGGQMGHRLALRKPDYFFGVHMHVNSSYDALSDDANEVLWLVTTGTREYGYPAGQRFYRDGLKKGYHMIFRAEENLGHSSSPETEALTLKFFDYCLKFIPDPTDENWKKPEVDQFYFMRYPTYVGDYFNQEAFPVKQAEEYVTPEFMVALPTKEIAEAWGTVIE
ncbi:hypothetical protein GCM10007047_24470 [Cerasicoccus arenae]|uniref:Alpha/beta hydrolase n=2 Tax=Cerasicoccus arenae TaxID=424488 RepID=A0A8J3DDG2_9BACT|nr:hypothetical protein GCM10007047_24470 [Cerasicoccus arenae]